MPHQRLAVLAFEEEEVAPEQWVDLQWTFTRACFRRTSREAMSTIRRFPAQLSHHSEGTSSIRVVHGSTASSTEVIRPDRNPGRIGQILGEIDEAVLIGGHTHEKWIYPQAGKLALNPGSVGGLQWRQPRPIRHTDMGWPAMDGGTPHRRLRSGPCQNCLHRLRIPRGGRPAGPGSTRGHLSR